MPFDYDILIAGGGPAGCAAAYDLARAGRRVLLLDKRSFPRPKACACGLTPKTLKALRYSVDPVIERLCREIVLQHNTHEAAERELRVRTRNPICAMAVRERFDDFCLQQTLAAGPHIELRKIETVLALREFPTHIEINVAAATGAETLTAPALIGADGSNGQSRRLAASAASLSSPPQEPDWYERGFALEATVPYADLPATLPGGGQPHDLVFDFSPLPGGYGWLFPKGGHINIGVGAFAPDAADEIGVDVSRRGSETWASTDLRLKQVTRALLLDYAHRKLGVSALNTITGQHLGMGGQHYVPRGRVLLAGDAAGLVDPLTGEGIHSAIVSGQAAAAAILSHAADIAAAYARNLAPLQQTLAFSHRAARAFYREPARGFRAMRAPLLRSLILKTYADGLPATRLLHALAQLV